MLKSVGEGGGDGDGTSMKSYCVSATGPGDGAGSFWKIDEQNNHNFFPQDAMHLKMITNT